MSLSAESVVAASNEWLWIPDNATTAETGEYLLVRRPDYFDHPLELIRFQPAGPTAAAVAAVLDRARQFGLPELYWMVRLGSPPEVVELLAGRGATVALVKGRVETSGPILRRAGFTAYGQELIYRVPLA